MNKPITLVIPAAGSGLRLDPNNPKQFLEHKGKKTLEWTLHAFEPIKDRLEKVVICLPIEYLSILKLNHNLKSLDLVAGGASRQESVKLGLLHLNETNKLKGSICLIHDAARPLLSMHDLKQLIHTLDTTEEAGLLAIAAKDTIKMANSDGRVKHTVPRENLWQAQTPQGGPGEWLLESHLIAEKEGWEVTDDASILEQSNKPVHLVPSQDLNFKITQSQDWELFKRLV